MRISTLSCLLLLALSTQASASQVGANPVVQRKPATAQGATVTLINNDSHAVTYDTSVVTWGDQPADGFVVTPRVVNIAPGASQVVRIYRSGRGQGYYNILAREVPYAGGKGVQVLTNLHLRLMFEDIAARIGPVVRSGTTLTNTGTRAARVRIGKSITTLIPGEQITGTGDAAFMDEHDAWVQVL